MVNVRKKRRRVVLGTQLNAAKVVQGRVEINPIVDLDTIPDCLISGDYPSWLNMMYKHLCVLRDVMQVQFARTPVISIAADMRSTFKVSFILELTDGSRWAFDAELRASLAMPIPGYIPYKQNSIRLYYERLVLHPERCIEASLIRLPGGRPRPFGDRGAGFVRDTQFDADYDDRIED